MSDAWVTALAASPWLYPALFALVVGDAFLVILPSETAVVALGALAGATGHPSLFALLPVAAVGAMVGDLLCFLIGRRIGDDRWRWQRSGKVGAAFARARTTVLRRPAALIFTARYIPFARIAVNVSAGASGLPLRRFLPLSAAAGIGWAVYNIGIGMLFGASMPSQPVVAVIISVVVAVVVGILVDAVITRVSAWRAASAPRRRRSGPRRSRRMSPAPERSGTG